VLAVLKAMAGAGCTDDQMSAVMLDASLPIGQHIRDQRDVKAYLERQIAKARQGTVLVLDPTNPMRSARAILAANYTADDGTRLLIRHRNAFWEWTGSYYRLTDEETIASKAWAFLDETKTFDAKGNLGPFKPTRSRVGDVVAAMTALTLIDEHVEPPAWLRPTEMPSADELFACGNGLLHLTTGKLHQPTPDFFNVAASEVAFDPKAPEPKQWLAFLDQLFGADKETDKKEDEGAIELLQEWSGCAMSPDLSQQKILMIFGPKRSGKGTIARILRILLGTTSVAGPTMSSLSGQFGLEPLITKPLAIIHDARIGKRTDKGAITERLLSISGEDTLTVDRKFKSAWHGRLPTRLMILTNEIPSLSEGSGALAGRFMILVMTVSFFGKEDPALTDKLTTEISGILNWSIEGYRRLRKRGHFVQPESSKKMAENIEILSAPTKAFIRDCCKVGPGFTVEVDELWVKYQSWCYAQGKTGAGDKSWFGRNLHSAVPGIDTMKQRFGKKRVQTYVGLRLINDSDTEDEIAEAAAATKESF
jgi:putative DNA primase/helicase